MEQKREHHAVAETMIEVAHAVGGREIQRLPVITIEVEDLQVVAARDDFPQRLESRQGFDVPLIQPCVDLFARLHRVQQLAVPIPPDHLRAFGESPANQFFI